MRVIARARRSAPGPNGPPAAGCPAPVRHRHLALRFDDAVRCGLSLPAWANEMLLVFLPKGSVDGDSVSFVRTATTVRALGIKSMVMRFFAAGWNMVLCDVVGQ